MPVHPVLRGSCRFVLTAILFSLCVVPNISAQADTGETEEGTISKLHARPDFSDNGLTRKASLLLACV